MDDYFSTLSFGELCVACEKVLRKVDRKQKLEALRSFIDHLFTKSGKSSFHPLMRLLLPKLERERGPYGVKEYNLARTYLRILCLPKEGQDAQRLLNYRAPSSKRNSDVIGDFAEVAYWVLRNKCGPSTNITIGEVNDNLDLIAQKHAARDPRAVDDVLSSLFRKMSADEQKWFIRIILKDMSLGLSTKQILYLYHPDSSEVYDLSNSLLKVCTTLKDRAVRLHELEITLFEAFRPMLSQRSDVSKFNMTAPLILENKYDGERFQLHISDHKFRYYSRNGFDYTQNYGEDEHSGYFTSKIKPQFSSTMESVILDGEMMGWNTELAHIVTRAANIDVKQLKMGNTVQPYFIAYDILYYNGEVLTNKPLSERKLILEKCMRDHEGTITKAPYSTVSTNEEILTAVNAAIDRCEEGIMLKRMDSVYKPNSRLSGWYKIKPEYTEGALVELDLLILGGYYGQGQMKGKVSHFLMGLAVPSTAGDNSQPAQFQSLCRVGSGFTKPELQELTSKLDPAWQKLQPGKIPSSHLLSREKPDLWIPPEKSCILQIKATEVVDSAVYYCGSTLKFVRVENIRFDKPWYNCLTTSEFQKMKEAYQGKLTSGPIANVERSSGPKRKNEIETLADQKVEIENHEVISDIFESKEFCVVSGFENVSKEAIEKTILEYGGRTRTDPRENTYCLIAGNINLRVKNFIRSSKHVVAHYSWLRECIEKGKLVAWTPLSLIGNTLQGKAMLSDRFDRFGDSFTEPTTPTELRAVCNKMMSDQSVLETSVLAEMEALLFKGQNPSFFFRGVIAHFASTQPKDQYGEAQRRMAFARLLFQFYGGVSTNCVDVATKVIIVDHLNPEGGVDDVVQVSNLEGIHVELQFVTSSWIIESCKANKCLSTQSYRINFD